MCGASTVRDCMTDEERWRSLVLLGGAGRKRRQATTPKALV
jgi:hypothetical protein